jgi:uncharacterized protein YjgD (DUF1641 family)
MSEDSHGPILAALDKVMTRLDALEAKVDGLGGGTAAVASDPLSRKLADPHVAEALARILDRVDTLDSATRVLQNVSERAPLFVDGGASMVEAFMSQAEADGIDVFARGFQGAALLEKASRPEMLELVDGLLDQGDTLRRLLEVTATPDFQRLVDGGLLDAAVIATAGSATTALVETRKLGFEPVGLFGTLGKLGDPDVKKAMGFLFALAKRFGAAL